MDPEQQQALTILPRKRQANLSPPQSNIVGNVCVEDSIFDLRKDLNNEASPKLNSSSLLNKTFDERMSSTADLLNTTVPIMESNITGCGLNASFDSTTFSDNRSTLITASKSNKGTPKPLANTAKKKQHFRRHCYSDDVTGAASIRNKSSGEDSTEDNFINNPAFLSPKRKREQDRIGRADWNSENTLKSTYTQNMGPDSLTNNLSQKNSSRNKIPPVLNLENQSDDENETAKSTITAVKGLTEEEKTRCHLRLPPGTIRKARRRQSSGKLADVENSQLPPVSSKGTPRSQRNRLPSSFVQTPFRSQHNRAHHKKTLSTSFPSFTGTRLQTPALTPKLLPSSKDSSKAQHKQKDSIGIIAQVREETSETSETLPTSLISRNDAPGNQVKMFTFGCTVPDNTVEEKFKMNMSQADNNDKVMAKLASSESSCTSASSPPSTPFRFTSFPASLPRVNNPRFCVQSTNQNKLNEPSLYTPRSTSPTVDLTRSYQSPIFGATHEDNYTSEKMSKKYGKSIIKEHFDHYTWKDSPMKKDSSSFNHGLAKTPHRQLNLSSVQDTSHDDTQNTSISSLSVDGHQISISSQNNGDLSRPSNNSDNKNSRKGNVWLSPVQMEQDEEFDNSSRQSPKLVKKKDKNDCEGCSVEENIFCSPVHAKLFADDSDGEEVNLSSDYVNASQHDSPIHSSGGKTIGRTRLNFNSLLSPGPMFQEEKHSFDNQNAFRDNRSIDTDDGEKC